MNPLSFSAYSGSDLPDLLCEAVVRMGFSREDLGRLESQTTLAVELQGAPDVMLSQQHDRLWIWSALPDVSEAGLFKMASQALSVLLEPVADVEGGLLTLGRGDEGFELKGLVNLACLSRASGLSDLLSDFRERLLAMCQALELQGE
ncbi:hypothetical protein [Chromobacterium sp. IIBBL 290-4]|uniref:InvB/SpaK family type III secretion system chaperone n=1 Tax=Chromobacterium sp. IIBBL 290-4 TaxID=2953890 RepID=UPI0020B81C69|nr:hypothetical protein [Chromobacterium sp. IIBBL 290-4]UTH74690.1 hypothetical protein NKT35_00815 [Chromobacterium sp. IIBBL 290-4]